MEAVAAVGYRAIAVDMRGYDRSSGPEDPAAYTVFYAVGDFVALLDALDLPEAAGKDSFYMFRQREPEADARCVDAATTYPGVLYWMSASPPPEERWDPLDAGREIWRQAPIACPPWADRADLD